MEQLIDYLNDGQIEDEKRELFEREAKDEARDNEALMKELLRDKEKMQRQFSEQKFRQSLKSMT